MKNIKIEKLFLVIGLIFGSLFIYLVPPFQSPDEDSHFKKAYVISKGQLYQKEEKDVVGLEIPNAMNDYIYGKLDMMGKLEQKYSYQDFYYDQLLPSDFSQKQVVAVSTSATTPIAHLIPGLGILTSRILAPFFMQGTPSTAYMLLFARFFSLVFYLLGGYFAIKTTPMFKKSMCAILLLPMSLFLGSMVSYDNLLIVMILLAVAWMLRLIYDKDTRFDKKLFILFTIIGYILLNIKVIYAPILALLLLVPKEKFKEQKKVKIFIWLILFVLFFTILLKIPNFITKVQSDSTLVSEQLQFVLHHPFHYIKILIYNFVGQFRIQMYWMIGTFGLLDTYLPPLFMILSFINLFLVFITDSISEKIKIDYKMKLIVFGFLVLAIVGMYTAMYISWTPQVLGIVGGKEITGVQGRYFIPLLISFPLLFSNRIFEDKRGILKFSNEYFHKSIIMMEICLIISIFVCITRFWI